MLLQKIFYVIVFGMCSFLYMGLSGRAFMQPDTTKTDSLVTDTT